MLRPHVRRVFRLVLSPRSRAAADMDEEIEFHIAARIERLVAVGWPADAARAEALRRFGPFEQTLHQLRADARDREERLHVMEIVRDTWQDIRLGARLVRRYPGFSAGAIVTLALGIGCASSMFAVVKHSLIDALPFAAPDRLVFMGEAARKDEAMMVSYPNFSDWRARTKSFEALESVIPQWTTPAVGGDEPVNARVQGVSRGLFPMLGVRPILGRWISVDENRPGGALAVMVSEDFWRQHLGATTNLASIKLSLFGNPCPVVGVMPRQFRILASADFWFGEEIDPIRIRGAGNYWAIGRLRRGVTLQSARAEMDGVAAQLKATYGNESLSSSVYAAPLRDVVIGSSKRPLLILLGAAGFVLLVTCINVAMMLLARGSARAREMAVRMALGSSHWRLVRQAVAETSILAASGVVGGVSIAWLSVIAIRQLGRGQLPRLNDLRFDLSVTAFAALVATAALVLFSVIPLVASRTLSRRALAGGGSKPSRTWTVLLVAQTAAAVMLVLGASLIVRTVSNILNSDLGYDPRGVTVARIPLPSGGDSAAATIARLHRVESSLRDAAPTSIVGLTSAMPTDRGAGHGPFLIPPIHDPKLQSEWAAIGGFRVVTPGYFSALGIRLVRGRMLDDNDRESAPDVAVVNAALAKKLWPGQDPIGKQVRALVDTRGALFTVVGVVANARDWQSTVSDQVEMFVPIWQRPQSSVIAVIKSPMNSRSLEPSIRRAIHTIDPTTPVAISALTQSLKEEIADRRFVAGLLIAFATAVLVLMIVGIFGAVSYAVAQRTREIGIRIAIGASPRGIWLGVQQRVVATVGCGALLGAAISWEVGRVMSSLLFGLTSHDAASFGLAVMSVLLAGAAAAAWPARRAAATQPSVALRTE